ncbi:beta-lactamase family protein [Cordyceps fumosorosea ARSEF 2679]|uniref:Beta-lactamase family protein n=1 Tax=Cordyceps fumosorosea (strain ARSEF 2679) TaxID=1081104 RepID=A0A167WMU0_CORFA|nr:beta-lactamase family protein [Cordyceps fumosorosea ARSEF 2679]OAA63987.1 beta-lactamase family protein [Cordyceps fumosorosea ARSEF 2679]
MKLTALLFSGGLAAAALECRPEGPVLPKPVRLGDAAAFRHAAVDLSRVLDGMVSGAISLPGTAAANLSFSVAVVSADQPDSDPPLWQHHHRAETNVAGTEHVDADSQYLIGSISKVITDFILLRAGLDLDVPVTTYLPLLSGSAHWDAVTLRMLASQTAGVPTNYGFSDFYFLKDVYIALGFPPIDESEYPPCGVIGLNDGCTAQQLQLGLRDSYPVVPPGARPAYSNAAFAVIALAVEAHTGLNYTELVRDFVSKPLGLKSTHPSPGDSSKAVIPPGDSGWGADYGVNAPQGGLISSASDLSKFAHALLTHTAVLSPAQTRQWLKPASFAGNMASAVGMPWEIRRYPRLTPNHPHPVAVYAKGGTAPLYRSQLALVDDYGLGIVVLTAGNMDALPYIYDAVVSVLVSAADTVTREYAEAEYAMEFASIGSLPSNDTVRARFTLDQDSLVLSLLSRGAADILAGWTRVFNESLGMFGPKISRTVRLFPTELSEDTIVDGELVVKEVWRLWPDLAAPPAVDIPGAWLDEDDCLGWMLGDWIHYGGEPLDRVLFYRQGTKVTAFEVPFLRSGIMKVA